MQIHTVIFISSLLTTFVMNSPEYIDVFPLSFKAFLQFNGVSVFK
jgi:hypothetical protein